MPVSIVVFNHVVVYVSRTKDLMTRATKPVFVVIIALAAWLLDIYWILQWLDFD
jgi:hypothetical protein